MPDQAEQARRFLDLHRGPSPLLLANAWDAGSARLLEHLGLHALATTSGGHAATLGRLDGQVTREEALAHAADIVRATSLPVSADLERGFADDPEGVAETVRAAIGAGLAGCSIEDSTGRADDPIYPFEASVERVAAAVGVAHGGPVHFVLTARAENFIHGRPDIDDTIARLQAFQEAGADVLFAPNVVRAEDIAAIVSSVDLPVNVVTRPGMPSVAELAEIGVARVSVGGAFAFAAYGTLVEAAQELLGEGTYGFMDRTAVGAGAARVAFPTPSQ